MTRMNPTGPVVDADLHNAFRNSNDLLPYLPKEWHRQWSATGPGVPGLYYSPVGVQREDARTPTGEPPGSDPDYVDQHHLTPYGIDYAVLTGSGVLGLSLHPDPDYANAVATAYNDWLTAVWTPHPKYKGSLLVNGSDPAAAAREIERISGHPEIVQVLLSSAASLPYGQRFYHPIYEAAVRADLPVAIHPGTEGRGTAGAPTPSGYPTRYFEWHNILPTNYMAHINSLVCEGVFEKFPSLTFVAIEGGIAWLPHLMWRMDKNYKALRSSTPWLTRRPSEYIRQHVKLTTQPIEEPDNPHHLVQVIEMAGAQEMLMFSSDYPHWDFDNPRISLPPLSKQDRHQVMSGNATALYRLGGEEQ